MLEIHLGRDALIAPGRNVEIHGGRCKQMEFEHKKAAPGANLAPDTALHSISNYSLLIINVFRSFFHSAQKIFINSGVGIWDNGGIAGF